MTDHVERPDLEILDSEPWREANQPIDVLINLQQQAFEADRAGNYQQFGTVLMTMSRVEHDIDNHGEAAAYASEAAEAFEKAGSVEDATAAHATVAKEYRTLFSPDLAVASLQEVIALTGRGSDCSSPDSSSAPLDIKTLPNIRLLANFVSTFSGVIFEDGKNGIGYPAVVFPKYPKLNRSTASEFLSSLSGFAQMPLDMTGKEAHSVLFYLHSVYSLVANRRFGLKGMDKNQAKFMADALGRLSFSLALRPDSSNAALLAGGNETVETLVSARNLRDLDFF